MLVIRAFIFFLLLLPCAVQHTHAQYYFSGRVVNAAQQPLAGANLLINQVAPAGTTNADGRFSFQHSSPAFQLSISHVGFATLLLHIDSVLPTTIVLQRNIPLEDEAIVYAFEGSGDSRNLAAAVTVLNKDDLQQHGTASLVAAVNTVPGVKMDERSPGSYRLSIRGNLLRSTFGVRNVKVYWNGIPFTDASGNTYLNQVAPENLGQMEILKGPSGSMYGSGTGGVVLLRTGASPTDTARHINVQVKAGSYGLLSANASYENEGPQATRISFSHQQADGYRQHSRMRRDGLHYTGSYPLSAKQVVSANVLYSDLFYQTPGGLTAAELAANPKQARPAAGAFRSAAQQQAAIYLKTLYAGISSATTINHYWKWTTGVYGSYSDFKNPTIRNYENKYEKGMGARTVLQYTRSVLTATFGAEVQRGFFSTGVYGNASGRQDTLQFNATIKSRQANVFAQVGMMLPANFVLEAGLSYNDFFYDYSRQNSNAHISDQSSFTPQVVPRISLLKKFAKASVYAAVSKGYSVPTIDEVFAGNDVFNKNLKAETAMNYELGVKATLLPGKLWGDVALYNMRLQNTIVSRRDAGGGDFYTNAGNTRQQGAELSLHYLPVNNSTYFIRRVKMGAAFTGIRARFNDYQQGSVVYDGNQLTGTPPHVLVLHADGQLANGFYVSTTLNYTNHIPLNDANTVYAPAYSLYLVKLGYRTALGKNNEANFFFASERADRNPYSLGNDLNAAGNRYYNPAAPQTLTAGMQLRFNMRK